MGTSAPTKQQVQASVRKTNLALQATGYWPQDAVHLMDFWDPKAGRRAPHRYKLRWWNGRLLAGEFGFLTGREVALVLAGLRHRAPPEPLDKGYKRRRTDVGLYDG